MSTLAYAQQDLFFEAYPLIFEGEHVQRLLYWEAAHDGQASTI